MEQVLPRVKVKKKRRKPPGPWFWFFLFWVLFCIGMSIFDIINVIVDYSYLMMCIAAGQIAFLMLYWYLFMEEWKKWRDEDL